MREQDLYLFGVGKFQRTQYEPWSLERWNRHSLKSEIVMWQQPRLVVVRKANTPKAPVQHESKY